MLNSVILTVKVERTELEYDMEFPANIPGTELCVKLLTALKNIESDIFRSIEKISIRVERSGELLGDEQTLESACIWDGSIITVEKRGW